MRLNLPVFPCLFDKSPAVSRGFHAAEIEPEKIRRLFTRYAGALIGVPTGETSGFDVLDLDTVKHEPARMFLQAVGAQRTRTHQTQSGGLHYLFRHHAGLRCSVGTGHRKGVDIRADGGYVIWWPEAGFAVNPLPLEAWPETLLARFLKSSRPIRSQLDAAPIATDARLGSLLRSVAVSAEGQRNKLLFWAACRLGEWIEAGKIERRKAELLLLRAANDCGLDHLSAARTIASGFHRDRA